ncbi:MAG: hypothetical protein ACQETI_13000 [Halobacteriota archaeon]
MADNTLTSTGIVITTIIGVTVWVAISYLFTSEVDLVGTFFFVVAFVGFTWFYNRWRSQ